MVAGSDVILSMARAGDPATRISYSPGTQPSQDPFFRRRQIRGQSPQFVIVDEASERDVIDKKLTPSRTHCLKCNVRMADRGNSRRRRSAAKSDYCLECAKRLTPSDVTASLLSAINKLPDDELWKRTSKPRKDALDKTLDFLETLTGWTREELRATAESLVEIANDRELGAEYGRMRGWMAKQKSADPRYETLWEQYRSEHITSIIIGMESARRTAYLGQWGNVGDAQPRGPLGTVSGLVLDVESDVRFDLTRLRCTFEANMNMRLDPSAIAILTGATVIS